MSFLSCSSFLQIFFLAFWLFPPLEAAAEAPRALGGTIVFAAGEQTKRSIMAIDLGVGLPRVLADTPGTMDTQPALGPSGQLAWIRQSGPDWDLIENGQIIASGAMYLSPAYMPDGTLVAALSGEMETNIYAFTASGEKKLLVSGGVDGLAVSPTFSPDGRKMAFVSNQTDIAQLFIADIGEGGQARPLTSGASRGTDPDWSPKGNYIAFVAAEKDICLIQPDGGGFKQLTREQGLNRDPAFSPDGSMIVFSSDRDGYWRLYIMNSDGGGQRPLMPEMTVSQALPVWTAANLDKLVFQ